MQARVQMIKSLGYYCLYLYSILSTLYIESNSIPELEGLLSFIYLGHKLEQCSISNITYSDSLAMD